MAVYRFSTSIAFRVIALTYSVNIAATVYSQLIRNNDGASSTGNGHLSTQRLDPPSPFAAEVGFTLRTRCC